MTSRLTALAASALLALTFSAPAFSAEPIEGTWKRNSNGALVKFAPCGGGYCGTVQSGEHKGKSIGKMSGSGGKYTGSLTDVAENKTYKGKASISGNVMKLSGCVAGGLICKGENWTKQ